MGTAARGTLLMLVWLGGGALLPACASKSKGGAEAPEAPANVKVAVEVENHGWSDVVIYLVRGTAQERLGTAGALHTVTFTIPFRRLGVTNDVRLKADPIGSDRVFYSEDIHLQPGQSIKWTLENDLSRSFLGIY